jgi:hypothetical protein
MSISIPVGVGQSPFNVTVPFDLGTDYVGEDGFTVSPSNPTDVVTGFVNNVTTSDGSPPTDYSNIFTQTVNFVNGGWEADFKVDVPGAFFAAHVGVTVTIDITLEAVTPSFTGGPATFDGTADYTEVLQFVPFPVSRIQSDYLGITRTPLSLDQGTTEGHAIDQGADTEFQFVGRLLSQVADTTAPAVAVEGTMYGAVGSSDEITKLATEFLPAQVANAIQNGFNPLVYSCEALGLAFAFGNENGATTFDTNFGPSNPATRATPAGDAAFAAEAASAIFGSAATANTPGAILQFVSNWEAFYTSHGVPGLSNATVEQIDLAARGAAWGDAVGVALVNGLGLLPSEVTIFLEEAAQNSAKYSAALDAQPAPGQFQGQLSEPGASPVMGVAAHTEHILI